MKDHLVTVKELSSFLHVHPKTIYKWVREEKIPWIRIGGLIRFDLKEIERWKKNLKTNPEGLQSQIPKISLSLKKYDRIHLKGRSALSKRTKRWNYGFGSIYLRKTRGNKERWYIDYRDRNGERIRKVVPHARTREEALLALHKEIERTFDQEHGIRRTKRVKFKELARQYLEDYATVNNLAWKRVESCLKKLKEFFGDHYLDTVTPLMIERYKQERLKQDIKPASVNRELSVLKRAFNLALKWRMTNENPVNEVRFLRQPEPRERILTGDEEDKLLEESADHLKPVIITALHTGMRKGEIVNLRWEQVDLEYREITVVRTKTGKKRIIPISDDLFEIFSILRRENSGDGYVFQYEDQETCEKKHLKYFRRAFENACRRAGIKGLTFHDLRHTFASRLLRAGVDLITVKELLGHYSVKTTERYTHTHQEEKKRAVNILGGGDSGNASKRAGKLSHIRHTEEKENFEKLLDRLLSTTWAVSSVGRAWRSQR